MKTQTVGFLKTLAMILVVLLLACFTATAIAQAVAPPPAITSDQVAQLDNSINTLIPLVPAQYRGALASAIAILGFVALLGRAVIGWRNGGLFGAIAGVFGGTNTPATPPATPPAQAEAAKTPKQASLTILFLLCLPCLLLCGCGTTQVVTVSKGTGLDADIPIGYNGANVFELKLKIGAFMNTTAVQPTSTNGLHAPSVSVASTTDGTVSTPTLTGSTSSNGVANVTGGEKYMVNLGDGNSAVSNAAGNATSQAQ